MMRVFLLAFYIFCLPLFSFSQAFKIDSFIVDSSFLKSNYKVIEEIVIIGNKRTKSSIISRELLFEAGDTLSNEEFISKLEQSKKNVLNTSLFNFANFDVAYRKSTSVIVVLEVTERWYIFPLPIFEIDDNNFNIWWRDRDYSRINYGMHLTDNNFRGRKEKLSITAKYGFTERYRLRYSIPYLTADQRTGLGISFSYNRKDEVTYLTLDNERLQYKNDERDALRNYSTSVDFKLRRAIFNNHSFGVGYDLNTISDSVRILNENYLGANRKRLAYLSLFYVFTHDKRDSRNYPLQGRYFELRFRKYGLGLIDESIDLTELQLEVKKFIPLSKKFYLAGSLRGLLSANNNQPYLLQRGLGYSSFSIRSYEFYVIDGQNIGLAKVQLKYELVKPRSFETGVLSEKLGKFHYAFYLGVFSDFAYVDDNIGFNRNNLADELQFGSGIGLDFVSYYDIVLRTEFSMNKFGETGIFVHFVAPI